jgi:CheY-like chemotaxis protein
MARAETDVPPAGFDVSQKLPVTAGESSAMRILLVEDHRDTREALARVLAKNGYAVETADDVAQAKQACKNQTFDLLICDIGLPDGDGWELMRDLRQICTTPGIALTGYGMAEDVQASGASGYFAHITKPVSFDDLLRTIHSMNGTAASPQ